MSEDTIVIRLRQPDAIDGLIAKLDDAEVRDLLKT